MKSIYLSFLIVCSVLLISNVAAADLQETLQNDSIIQGAGKIQEISEQQNKTEFLKQEWRKFLETNAGGRLFLKISDTIEKANPIINKIIGIDYSLSWAFVFGVIIWLALFLLLLRPMEALLSNQILAIVATVAVVGLIGITGVIRKTVDILGFAIQNWWIALISVIVAFILVVVVERLGKTLKRKIERAKESSEKEKVDKDRKIIRSDAKIAKEDLDSYK